MKILQVRSPEEYLSSHNPDDEQLTAKVDVYALGNILYAILMKERVFRHYSTKSAQNSVKNGRLPKIDQKNISKFTEIEMSIYRAMKMCHVFDVTSRNTAQEVELYLRNEMKRLHVSFYDDE